MGVGLKFRLLTPDACFITILCLVFYELRSVSLSLLPHPLACFYSSFLSLLSCLIDFASGCKD